MPNFQFGRTSIDYAINYQPNRKDVIISIEWLDGVKITAPENITQEKLQAILHKKAPWILNKWRELNEIADPPLPKEFISGEKFSYLGRQYRLKVYQKESGQTTLSFHNGRFIAEIPENVPNKKWKQELYEQFKQWYIKKGTAKVKTRVELYAPKIMKKPEKVILKEQKMRWGTCTDNKSILLNWKLMMAPIPVIDYVIVHEMVHLKHPDHSKDFWKLVHAVLPDYEWRKEWLRVNGPRLSLE